MVGLGGCHHKSDPCRLLGPTNYLSETTTQQFCSCLLILAYFQLTWIADIPKAVTEAAEETEVLKVARHKSKAAAIRSGNTGKVCATSVWL